MTREELENLLDFLRRTRARMAVYCMSAAEMSERIFELEEKLAAMEKPIPAHSREWTGCCC